MTTQEEYRLAPSLFQEMVNDICEKNGNIKELERKKIANEDREKEEGGRNIHVKLVPSLTVHEQI